MKKYQLFLLVGLFTTAINAMASQPEESEQKPFTLQWKGTGIERQPEAPSRRSWFTPRREAFPKPYSKEETLLFYMHPFKPEQRIRVITPQTITQPPPVPQLPRPVPISPRRYVREAEQSSPSTPEYPISPAASVTPPTSPEFKTPEQAPLPLVVPRAPVRPTSRLIFPDE